MLSVILWLPLAVGLVCFLLPQRLVGPWALARLARLARARDRR